MERGRATEGGKRKKARGEKKRIRKKMLAKGKIMPILEENE